MPYRVSGKTVQVKRGGRWVPLHVHKSAAEAKVRAAALRINVKHGKEGGQ